MIRKEAPASSVSLVSRLLSSLMRRRTSFLESAFRSASSYETGMISYEDALRNADSKNEVRLRIKLESKRESKLTDEAGASLRIMDEETEGAVSYTHLTLPTIYSV